MESDTKSFFRADQSKKHPVCYPSSGIFILDLIFFRAWVSTLPREDVFSCLVPASLGRWAFSSIWCCWKSTLNILFFLGHSLSLFWNMMSWWPSGNYGTRWEWRSVVHVSVLLKYKCNLVGIIWFCSKEVCLNSTEVQLRRKQFNFAQGTSLHPLHWRTGHIKEARGRTIHDADCGQV